MTDGDAFDALLQRHAAAMEVVADIPPEERFELLAFVVEPSEAVEVAQERAAAA